MRLMAFFTYLLLTGMPLLTSCTTSPDASTARAIEGMEEAQRASGAAAVSAKDTVKAGEKLPH